MTIEEMRKIKQQNGYSYAQIAEASGVPLSTVQKVLMGETKAPRFQTIQALSKAFENFIANPLSRENAYLKMKLLDEPYMLQETPAVYGANALKGEPSTGERITTAEEQMVWGKLPAELRHKRQGQYTYEDFLKLPEELHFELIDGVFYDLATPRFSHQMITTLIGEALRDYIRKQHGHCIVLPLPFDTLVQNDNRTCVEPDLQIICDRSKITEEKLQGNPDFIMEVLSPSTRKKDMTVKLQKYLNSGVKEYWMVDLSKKEVIVYTMTEELLLHVYSFEDQIPVQIWNGKCIIDMKSVYQELTAITGETQ